MRFMKRIGLTAGSLLIAGSLAAPAALADVSCSISGNGADSRNSCNIRITRNGGDPCDPCNGTDSAQINRAKVKNKIRIRQNTGNNKANKNTGGNVTIETGNNTATVTITNDVNN